MLQYFDTLADLSGNALQGAKLQVLNWPSLTAASIFSTNGTASPIPNNTVVADITGQVSFYLEDGAYQFVYSYNGTTYKTRAPVQITDPLSFVVFPDTGSVNAYAITDQRLPAQLYVGLKVEMLALHTNTLASTFNMNGTGAVPIIQSGGAALVASNINANGLYRLEYDGTSWQLVSLEPVTAVVIGSLIFPQTAAELAAGITPTNFTFQTGDLRRYGATGGPAGAIPAADDSSAFLQACKAGLVIVPPEMAFKIVTGVGNASVPLANQVIIQGSGDNSQLYCDTGVTLGTTNTVNWLLYCSGAGTIVRDVYIANITAPLKWQRRVETTAQTTASLLGTQTFTGSVAGATTGTLTAGITNGVYSFFFSDGEIRTVTITGTTTASWSGALSSTAGAITTATVATIIVGSAAGIAIGQQATGYGLATGSVVTGISGLFVTLSDPVPAGLTTPTVGTYTFFGITFNQTAALLATLAFTNAAGFISPSNNDAEWTSLTSLQQQQAWIGPVITLTGDNTLIQNVKGRNFQFQMSGNNVRALFNRLQGGWNWGCIAFLNLQINPVEYSCYAFGNQCDDHAYNGIAAMGYDGVTYIGNSSRGVGETCFKIFPWANVAGNTPGSVGCRRIISEGNTAVAGFQGNFDYNAPFLPTATPGLSQCIAIGDYAAWSPFGGVGYQGSGWTIDVTAEMNAGVACVAQIDHSKFRIKAMENTYANLNTGVTNTVAVQGNNNVGDGLIIYNKTTRTRGGFSLAFYGGSTQLTSSSLVNSDLRDNVTTDANTLQLAFCVDLFNLRGNGPLSDVPVGARYQISLGLSASIAINAAQARSFLLFIGSATTPTFQFPTNLPKGPIELEFVIENGSGGAITPAFAAGYKTATIASMPNATMSTFLFFWNGISLYQKYAQMTTVPL